MSNRPPNPKTYLRGAILIPTIVLSLAVVTPIVCAMTLGRGVALSCQKGEGTEGHCQIQDRRMFGSDTYELKLSSISSVSVQSTLTEDLLVGDFQCYFPELVVNENGVNRRMPVRATCSENKANGISEQLTAFMQSADGELQVSGDTALDVLLYGTPMFGISLLLLSLLLKPGAGYTGE